MKKLFIVLGMHRSATSLTAGILSSYGMYAGREEDLLEATIDNQKGFFENKNVFLLDELIWCENGVYSSSDISEKINLINNTKYSYEIENIIQSLLGNSANEQDIFIKDPRMCITEPVWRKEIQKCGLEENIIVVFRHPFEVARSLQKRDNMNFIYALKLWFYYNLSILYCIADSGIPVLVLNHENYFNEKSKQISKLENFIQYSGVNNKASDFVDISLRHNVAGSIDKPVSSGLENMVFELYRYLIALSDSSNVIISKNELKQYESYLEKMACTSYDYGQEDMVHMMDKDTKERIKKVWCTYQLYNKREILILKFKDFFKKYKAESIYIYGNGTLTEVLVPVLNGAGISIKKIIDKSQKGYIEDLQNAEAQTYILNTVVNYGDSVSEDLCKYFKPKFILDIYNLLNKLLKIV
ncbi:MAG: hypothetical protein HFH68_08510 [Lachnospiraceae bacterium]|nr:hypothetical protein [Lachnospiraceae bacterium]